MKGRLPPKLAAPQAKAIFIGPWTLLIVAAPFQAIEPLKPLTSRSIRAQNQTKRGEELARALTLFLPVVLKGVYASQCKRVPYDTLCCTHCLDFSGSFSSPTSHRSDHRKGDRCLRRDRARSQRGRDG